MSEFQIRGFCLHLCTLRRFYLISYTVFKENLLIFLSSLITNSEVFMSIDTANDRDRPFPIDRIC